MEKPYSTYTPTQEDVFAVRRALLHFLPAELVIDIVELAEYWPKVSSTREAFDGPATASGGRDEEWCYVLSPPVPHYPGLSVKPRRITFNVECVAECTYDSVCSNYTKFQAAVIKSTDVSQNIMFEPLEDSPERQIHSWNISNPKRWLIQDVPSAWPEGEQHKLVMDQQSSAEEAKSSSEPEPLLHNMHSGDRVAVMVRGLIPGWMNCIYTITAEVHYAI